MKALEVIFRADEGAFRACRIFEPLRPLTNFEIEKHYQNELKCNGVYSINNLPTIKDGSYIINFDKLKSIGTHWIPLHVNNDNVNYFDSFVVEHIPK